jgi:hypothetical protein
MAAEGLRLGQFDPARLGDDSEQLAPAIYVSIGKLKTSP